MNLKWKMLFSQRQRMSMRFPQLPSPSIIYCISCMHLIDALSSAYSKKMVGYARHDTFTGALSLCFLTAVMIVNKHDTEVCRSCDVLQTTTPRSKTKTKMRTPQRKLRNNNNKNISVDLKNMYKSVGFCVVEYGKTQRYRMGLAMGQCHCLH